MRAFGSAILALVVATATLAQTPGAARAETLRIGTIAPDGSVYMRDLRAIAADVEQLSGGSLKIKWYSAGRLGDDADMARELGSPDSRIDGAAISGIGLAILVPRMRVWLFPGLFRSWEEVDFVRHEVGDADERAFRAQGYEIMIWGDVGFSHIFSNRPITTLAELRKHRLWVWRDDSTSVDAANLLKLDAVAERLATLADWLEAKKIDTWVFPPLAILAFGLLPSAKTMSDLRWHFIISAIVIKKDVYDALPEEHRRVLRSVASKWQSRVSRSWQVESEKAERALEKQGVKIVIPSDAEAQAFYLETSALADVLARRYGLEPELRAISDALTTYRAAQR